MYIDFHTHGKLAKKLPFSIEYTNWLFDEAKKAGLDALCLTEHFNTLQFGQMYQYVYNSCDKDGDTLVTENGLRIFTGMETDIAQGGHVLCVGTFQEIMELNRRLEPYKEKNSFLSLEQLLNLFSEYLVIIGAAHPYREGGHIPEQPLEQLRRFHFLDLNGKDIALDCEATKEEVYKLGNRLGIPIVSGSDTHQSVQYGCIRTCMEHEVNTVRALYDEMLAGRYQIMISNYSAFQVKTAGLLKKALKAVHAAGGDYVSVLLNQDAV